MQHQRSQPAGLAQPVSQVAGRPRRRSVGLLLGRRRHPAAQPLRDQLGAVRAEPPRAGRRSARAGRAGRRPRRPPSGASGPSSRRPATVRRWWASKAAANAPSRGSGGSSSTCPATDRVSSAGQPAAGAGRGQRVQLGRGEQVQQRRGGDQVGAGQVGGAQPAQVGGPGLDPHRRGRRRRAARRSPRPATASRRRVVVVQHPALRAGQLRGQPARHRPGAGAQVVHRPAGRSPQRAPAAARPAPRPGPRGRPARAGPARPGRTRGVGSAGRSPRAPHRLAAQPVQHLVQAPCGVLPSGQYGPPFAGRPPQPVPK